MIAAWMLESTLMALLITAATFAVDYAVRALGRPTRFVWVVALIVSFGASGVRAFWPAEAGTGTASGLPIAPRAAATRHVESGRRPSTARSSVSPRNMAAGEHGLTVPRRLEALDRPLVVLWAAASLAWAALLFGSGARLRRWRRSWRPELLDGTPVFVSHDVGPALFGIARYSIVVPAWVLELPVAQRALIVAHEREHARAGDAVVRLGGALSVLVQPWNPLVWAMFRRLCFAVEADCDARVLTSSPDVREYGELLIDIGARTLSGASPVAALSEPHSLLERRISRMTARPFTRPVLRAIGGSTVAAVALVGACQVPRPTIRPTTTVAITPEVDFIQYRWVDTSAAAPARYSDASGQPLALSDSVVLDIAGIDSAWVSRYTRDSDTSTSVLVSLLPDGAARFGAATATHVGRRVAVVLDGRVATMATIGSALGARIPLVTGVSRIVADSLAARVNHIAAMLRPIQPLTISRAPRERNDSARERDAAGPAIVHITSVGLELADTAPPRIRIYTTGLARVGLGLAAPAELRDTLRLDHLPAMTLDVTSGTVHLEIDGPSRMRIGGEGFEMRGRKFVVARNGMSASG